MNRDIQMPPEAEPMKIALIIIAQNESQHIKPTVLAARKALRQCDNVFVVADNCVDDTAVIAKKSGAIVLSREQLAPAGKGAAITWFIQEYSNIMFEYSYLVILDADSLIEFHFKHDLEKLLQDGKTIAAQCRLSPIDFEISPISTLIALSDILEQTVFDRFRSRLGWSVRMRGTGMVLKPQLLFDISKNIDTEVEDLVMCLLLAERQILVKSFASAIVYDPKPTITDAASRQRARWFRGQWVAFWKHRSIILKLF